MQAIINALFRRKKAKRSNQEKLNAATAKKVLEFVSYGLTYGAESLASQYKPKSKVREFTAVSLAILSGLKPRQNSTLLTDCVVISVHVNDQSKQIKLMQVGEHVMLVLDGCEIIISFTTLSQIYTSLRNDIISHGDIYGKTLVQAALSCPAAE